MLSYRHSFHAGNFADVLKHIVLVEILEYLVHKDKAFDYIDTHAGAGLYSLKSAHAQKLGECLGGVGRLRPEEWPELAGYFAAVTASNSADGQDVYPGSPMIARHFMRQQDRAWLFELHPEDYEFLSRNVGRDRRLRVRREDGFRGLLALLPPVSRRGLVLMDPSYEIKNDYQLVFETLEKAYRKSPTLTYAIWYPVVDRERIDQLEKKLIKSGIRDIQQFELGLAADNDQPGMTASGMIVINPPWVLMEKMQLLLPRLVAALADNDEAFHRSVVLVPE